MVCSHKVLCINEVNIASYLQYNKSHKNNTNIIIMLILTTMRILENTKYMNINGKYVTTN